MTTTLNGWDVEAMTQAVTMVKEQPEAGLLTWRGRSIWDGGFGLDVRTREIEQLGEVMNRHFTLRSDHPPELLGHNTGTTAVETVLAALGACMTGQFAAEATRRGVRIDSLTVDLECTTDLNGRMFGTSPADPPRTARRHIVLPGRLRRRRGNPAGDPRCRSVAVTDLRHDHQARCCRGNVAEGVITPRLASGRPLGHSNGSPAASSAAWPPGKGCRADRRGARRRQTSPRLVWPFSIEPRQAPAGSGRQSSAGRPQRWDRAGAGMLHGRHDEALDRYGSSRQRCGPGRWSGASLRTPAARLPRY